MKILLAYVCVSQGKRTEDFAARFATTYHKNPPGTAHDSVVLCNGGPLRNDIGLLFSEIGARFVPRVNEPGWDVSAFIDLARLMGPHYDMLLCLGESAYFHRAGWLKRLAEAWEKHGPGMYGPLSSNALLPHLNTTAFCCLPNMLAAYQKPNSRAERYQFEHGPDALWRRVEKNGYPVRMVTWDGEWRPQEWRNPQNILWRGDQSNCPIWTIHVENFFKANHATRMRWSRLADSPFK